MARQVVGENNRTKDIADKSWKEQRSRDKFPAAWRHRSLIPPCGGLSRALGFALL